MISSAAPKTAAAIAREFADVAQVARYSAASVTIARALPQMVNPDRQTYADVRFAENEGANNQSLTARSGKKVFLRDTTANVSVLWGFPNHRAIELSNAFYATFTVALGGDMRYFDSTDPGLARYGIAPSSPPPRQRNTSFCMATQLQAAIS